jgi:hypothetical protein
MRHLRMDSDAFTPFDYDFSGSVCCENPQARMVVQAQITICTAMP